MTTKKVSNFNEAIKATPASHLDFLVVEPFDEDGGDLCPDSEAILRFVLRADDADQSLKYHLLVCVDCRVEADALGNAMKRLERRVIAENQEEHEAGRDLPAGFV